MKPQMEFSQATAGNLVVNVLLLVVVAAAVAVFMLMQPSILTLEDIRSLFSHQDSEFALYIVSSLLMLLCALTPLPAEVIALGNTFVFSPWEAFFVTWVSAVASSCIGYELGRLSKYDPCKINKTGKMCQLLNKYGYSGLAIMRLIPVVPFFALNICGGIFKLNRMKFVLITSISISPAIAILTFFPRLFL